MKALTLLKPCFLFIGITLFVAIGSFDLAQEKLDVKLLYHKQKNNGAEIEIIIFAGVSHYSLDQKDLERLIRGGL